MEPGERVEQGPGQGPGRGPGQGSERASKGGRREPARMPVSACPPPLLRSRPAAVRRRGRAGATSVRPGRPAASSFRSGVVAAPLPSPHPRSSRRFSHTSRRAQPAPARGGRAVPRSPRDPDRASRSVGTVRARAARGRFPEEGRRNPQGEGALAGDAANGERPCARRVAAHRPAGGSRTPSGIGPPCARHDERPPEAARRAARRHRPVPPPEARRNPVVAIRSGAGSFEMHPYRQVVRSMAPAVRGSFRRVFPMPWFMPGAGTFPLGRGGTARGRQAACRTTFDVPWSGERAFAGGGADLRRSSFSTPR